MGNKIPILEVEILVFTIAIGTRPLSAGNKYNCQDVDPINVISRHVKWTWYAKTRQIVEE